MLENAAKKLDQIEDDNDTYSTLHALANKIMV